MYIYIFILAFLVHLVQATAISEVFLIFPRENENLSISEFAGISISFKTKDAHCRHETETLRTKLEIYDSERGNSTKLNITYEWKSQIHTHGYRDVGGWSTFSICLVAGCIPPLASLAIPPSLLVTAQLHIELSNLRASASLSLKPPLAEAPQRDAPSHTAGGMPAAAAASPRASSHAFGSGPDSENGGGGGDDDGGGAVDWARYDPAADAAHFAGEEWVEDPARWHDWWRRGRCVCVCVCVCV